MQKRLILGFLIGVLSFIAPSTAAQRSSPVTGIIHTPDVDLGYEVYGQPTSETPLVAVNGGPGLSHKYMIQNDVWERLAQRAQIVFYSHRGPRGARHVHPGAPPTLGAPG